jgi:LPXTG-motif cell wall-anchored protein
MEEHKTASTNSPEVTNWALFGMGVLVVIGFLWSGRRRRSFLPDR